jgi:hypothetical protein
MQEQGHMMLKEYHLKNIRKPYLALTTCNMSPICVIMDLSLHNPLIPFSRTKTPPLNL